MSEDEQCTTHFTYNCRVSELRAEYEALKGD